MNARGIRLSGKVMALAFGLALMGAPPLAAQDDCQPVFDALDKVMNTATHIYTTTKSGGTPHTTETIYTADAIYTNDQGKWEKSKIKPAQVMKQEQENRHKSTYACTVKKEEPIEGEMAKVYTSHSGVLGQTTDSQIWISKKTGLPLRNEVDIDTGDKSGKSHYSVRYDYKNAKAPKL